MKSFLRTFLLSFFGGFAAWLLWGLVFNREQGIWYSVRWAATAALALAVIASLVARYRENLVAETGPGLDNEVLLHAGRASREGIVGWLYVTDRRLLFEGYPEELDSPEISTVFDRFPSDKNDDEHYVSVPVLQVSRTTPRSLGIASNIEISLADGRKMSFLVDDPSIWVEEIATARQMVLDDPRPEKLKLFP